MQKTLSLKLLPRDAANEQSVKETIAEQLSIAPAEVTGYTIIKRSIDARAKQAWYNLTVLAYVSEPYHSRKITGIEFPHLSQNAKRVIVVGAGPAGLFASLKLVEHGIKPVILERGKEVRARRRDLALLNKEGEVNPESNYCFGEGGAGTYSDGKLYTRSSKRGDINRILQLFVQFGADERILFDAHPHIGTNKLPQIITAMRQQLVESGAEFWFGEKMTDLVIRDGSIQAVTTASGNRFEGDAVILATGHSARDVFELLDSKKILIEPKPFALGVRVEHPQALIDAVQYHAPLRDENLPPASYSLVQQVQDKGVFSFCMCPGGIIAPAATSPGELVVNGWSPSKRNNPFANSGIVVTVEHQDIPAFSRYGNLACLAFQRSIEQQAFAAGGGKFVAPAQRLTDFTENKLSASLPACSYLPGLNSVALSEVLPAFINERLKQGFIAFGKKMRGYLTNEAVVVATESRTSSPVRIPRNPDTLEHPQIQNLYPAAEGAGYAGGIVSAAMDGERIADILVARIKKD